MENNNDRTTGNLSARNSFSDRSPGEYEYDSYDYDNYNYNYSSAVHHNYDRATTDTAPFDVTAFLDYLDWRDQHSEHYKHNVGSYSNNDGND